MKKNYRCKKTLKFVVYNCGKHLLKRLFFYIVSSHGVICGCELGTHSHADIKICTHCKHVHFINTVFPRIVSALDQYPPSNSVRTVCFSQ